METKHTKGEWVASPDGRAVYSDEKKCLIAMCEGRAAYPINERESNMNAKLIASAPDLLEALMSMKIQIRSWKKLDKETLGHQWAIKAEQAIKKATS